MDSNEIDSKVWEVKILRGLNYIKMLSNQLNFQSVGVQ